MPKACKLIKLTSKIVQAYNIGSNSEQLDQQHSYKVNFRILISK
jgi:hypothetical protein